MVILLRFDLSIALYYLLVSLLKVTIQSLSQSLQFCLLLSQLKLSLGQILSLIFLFVILSSFSIFSILILVILALSIFISVMFTLGLLYIIIPIHLQIPLKLTLLGHILNLILFVLR